MPSEHAWTVRRESLLHVHTHGSAWRVSMDYTVKFAVTVAVADAAVVAAAVAIAVAVAVAVAVVVAVLHAVEEHTNANFFFDRPHCDRTLRSRYDQLQDRVRSGGCN